MSRVLVTGGAGYIGAHVCKELRAHGIEAVCFDNLQNGNKWAIQGPFFYGDLQNQADIEQAIKQYQPIAVIHLAGSIDLRESVEQPFVHYTNNIIGTLNLLQAMTKYSIQSLVFSSSAAIYAPPTTLPIKEDAPKDPITPYGKTKWMAEQIFHDLILPYGLHTVTLRYFNAAGADPNGELGEAHNPEAHLIPCLIQTALEQTSSFTLYNTSLPTKDGTAIRDFVHVSDLADAHVKALSWLQSNKRSECFNLGTGVGYSVKQVIQKIEDFSGRNIPITIAEKPVEEVACLIADPKKANELLGWTPRYSDLSTIIETAWNWHLSQTVVSI